MKDNIIDMTEGNPVKLLISFSIPMLIGNLFQQVYNLADSVIVGQLVGSAALASIGTTTSISFFFFALCNGIASGGGIITSQFFGQKDDNKVKNCITNTGYIMIIFPLVVGTASFFLAGPILHVLNTPENIFNDAKGYLKILCIGLLFVSLYNYASSMLRALGDSKTPLYCLIFTCVLNIILDVIFVKYFCMGVKGAGWATIISQFLSAALCLFLAFKKNPYFKFEKINLRINHEIIRQTIKIGVPLSFQFSMIAISCMALQAVVNGFGDTTVAAFTATSRIEQIIHLPYQTLSAALSTFCGQNYGAKKIDRAILGYKKAMLLMGIFTLVMFPIIQLGGESIIRFFVKKNEVDVIKMGATALKITSLFYLFLGTIYMVRGILYGVGDAFFSMLNGIVEVFGRFTAPFILTKIPFIGLWGIWWSVGFVWSIAGLTAWWRYIIVKRRIKKQYETKA